MDFLTRIVEYKKEEIATARRQVPESVLRTKARQIQSNRAFGQILATPDHAGVTIIAEIKRASPSKGIICADLDAARQAKAYEQGGAAALSVLTDRHFFSGSPADLKTARQATILPVLRKDFLISSYQIFESKALGADAVLLIVRILSKRQLHDYLSLCRELKLDALVEIHCREDLEITLQVGARFIGINNRNLASFETDVRTAATLAGMLGPDQVAVAASGIRERKDIKMGLQAGIHNFLVGESLVRASDPAGMVQVLKGIKKPEG
jgi:indole-3-glycerol phosphate synthase